ncbi:MAG: hypothetical protein JJE51_10105 [Thermoanaerobaculia bacterium]|nr:hypothetical protein [Thermoanaerobaculia bacterium]
MSQALRVLLETLIDYAGLYPPASLPFEKAVANYEAYRGGEHAWALGRLVVPIAKAADVPADFPLAVVIPSVSEESAVSRFLADARKDVVIEIKATSAQDIDRIAAFAQGRTAYVEIDDLALIEPIARHRLRAKLRTGGVTAVAFPAGETVAAFIQACRNRNVAFKATAGLHHPIRCVKPLTYETNAATGTMHGFLNVFIAAALPQFAAKIMREENPRAFAFDDGGLWWHDCRVTIEELARVRETFAISFGSCSFEEPISDMKELGWL